MDDEKELKKAQAKNRSKANREEKQKIKEVKEELKNLGIYDESNDETISLLAKKLVMLERLWFSLSSDDFTFSTGTAAGNPKGNP